MLISLDIRDFVIVDRLSLDFTSGFGTLTGETGAGKSILVDALSLVLGERSDSALVRAGCNTAEIAARFNIVDIPGTLQWLRDTEMVDADTPEELLLRRVIDAGGRGNRAWINGVSASLAQIRELSELLVDIHGQHAHQSLLRTGEQRKLLDSHAGLTAQADEVTAAWCLWRETVAALEAASRDHESAAREREQLQWQVRELEALAFDAAEWESLQTEHKRLAHAASLIEGAAFALEILADSESAASQQVDAVVNRLTSLADYDPALAEVSQILHSVQTELGEAVSSLRRYAGSAELEPERQAQVETRVSDIENCARKYRLQAVELPQEFAVWQARLASLESSANLGALGAQAQAQQADYRRLAQALSQARRRAASALSDAVSQIMRQLALSNGHFSVVLIEEPEGSAHGLETVEFRVSGLAGNEPRPLAKVASGGELSRISLAIQVVTARSTCVPTLIFDEVDAGIGGGVAEIVGRLLRELGAERQVLCVTHLPQVAARANWQWQVSKYGSGNETRSLVRLLTREERVAEIARMLGGVETTELSRQHALEMLEQPSR